jgi:aminoglycoside phosphotransferase (APT) family kinase protein
MGSEAAQTRTGEELNTEGLAEYLCSKMPVDDSGIEILQFPAGSSNLTYLVTIGGAEYVLRRPPFGNTVKSAHDMSREFRVLSKLSSVYPPAPKPLLFCSDESVIGSEFYLMERRNGLIIRGKMPDAEALVGAKRSSQKIETLENSHSLRIRVCESFVRNLVELHALDCQAAGLSDLGKPEGYCRRQVEGWTKRYFAAKTNEWPELESAISWLNKNIPTGSGASLVHNDYKFDNVMLDPNDLTRITAVLDWEMVTVGDPLMDLGTTLGYWMGREAGGELLNMPFNPRVLMENISRSELVEMYATASGRDVSNILFYYVFGTFKIAVIAQQIYARYVNGFTKDARFANFDKFVSALGNIASNAVQKKTL